MSGCAMDGVNEVEPEGVDWGIEIVNFAAVFCSPAMISGRVVTVE